MGTVEHFKTLCCLGLPLRPALMAIAGAVREVVPAQWTRIGLIDNERPTIGFGEHPEFMPLFLPTWESFYRDKTSVVTVWMSQLAKGGIGVGLPLQNGTYLGSAYYNEFEKKLDSCWLLDAVLHDGKRAIGSMVLSRPRTAKPFGTGEVNALDALRPWMVHALQAENAAVEAGPPGNGREGEFADGVPLRHATAVFDAAGREMYRTAGTGHLYLILDGTIDNHWRRRSPPDVRTPAIVGRVVKALVATARGKAAPCPRATVRTPWGRITIEASWLTPTTVDPAGLAADIAADPGGLPIAVNLGLHEHAVARAARVLRVSGASPGQTRVGVLLATGLSKPEIARQLGIAETSVIDAARKLHRRLGTRNAAELGMHLWLEEPDVPDPKRR